MPMIFRSSFLQVLRAVGGAYERAINQALDKPHLYCRIEIISQYDRCTPLIELHCDVCTRDHSLRVYRLYQEIFDQLLRDGLAMAMNQVEDILKSMKAQLIETLEAAGYLEGPTSPIAPNALDRLGDPSAPIAINREDMDWWQRCERFRAERGAPLQRRRSRSDRRRVPGPNSAYQCQDHARQYRPVPRRKPRNRAEVKAYLAKFNWRGEGWQDARQKWLEKEGLDGNTGHRGGSRRDPVAAASPPRPAATTV